MQLTSIKPLEDLGAALGRRSQGPREPLALRPQAAAPHGLRRSGGERRGAERGAEGVALGHGGGLPARHGRHMGGYHL